ncbi:carboxylesterase/lipase family protein [Actinomadura nitritigenes]|uniref:carboxylesterase/lipase family protein n=1 Tax=Actinomadura nitritigenes TaxID=134602 RepID=UPI003D89CA2A
MSPQHSSQPVVSTDAGRVRGFVKDGVTWFLGIPYGGSTAGRARFGPPPPVTPWTGIRDAMAYGPAAPQTNTASAIRNPWITAGRRVPGMLIMRTFMGSLAPHESEDCLNLNVFTGGARGSVKRPVLVWLHGGGFNAGTANSSAYDGSGLARRLDVVVVGVNHRLGALGYLHLAEAGDPDLAHSGNAGTLDQIAALQWVRRNIAAFGGDPERVLIFGQSGGGWKVSTLLASPAAAGLFSRAVIQSGPGVTMVPRDRAAEIADRFLLEAGAKNPQGLRGVPAERLVAAQHVTEAALPPRIIPNILDGFAPVIDPEVLPDHPFAGDPPASSAEVPLIIGHTRTEMTLFSDTKTLAADDHRALATVTELLGEDRGRGLWSAYADLHPIAPPARKLAYLLSDLTMFPFVGRILQARRSVPAETYSYRFDWETPVLGGALMAPHGVEIPFIFGTLDATEQMTGPVVEGSRALAARMSATWAAFAETGTPAAGPSGLAPWPAYRNPENSTLLIDHTPSLEDGLVPKMEELLSGLVEPVRERMGLTLHSA